MASSTPGLFRMFGSSSREMDFNSQMVDVS